MAKVKLDITQLITIDDNGMPVPPNTAQLLDREIRELYGRDKTKNKERYIQEAIVIYYLGDPKSPAKQAGLSDAESLKMAIEQANLPKDYIPDALVIRLIKRYYDENIGEAGRTVENILKGIHLIKKLEEAKQNLLYEKETELSRGGNVVSSSMDADNYM